MTDRFKDISIQMGAVQNVLLELAHLPIFETIREALTLATESEQQTEKLARTVIQLAARNSEIEQLRKERDELASALKEYYIMYGDRSIISSVDDLLEKAGILND